MVGFVLWSHLGSGSPVFHNIVAAPSGWASFKKQYAIDGFGADGYFVRAVQNGYNLVFHTHEAAWRFTRRTADDAVNACADCHTPENLAQAFVTSDRYDPALGKRISFEEAVMRCYAGRLDGFVPTQYDPAVRDIRIFARAIAHHLNLSEGEMVNTVTASASTETATDHRASVFVPSSTVEGGQDNPGQMRGEGA